MSGFWTWLFLGRISMITGWVKLLTRPFRRSHDFVSVDARRFSTDPRHYEMILSPHKRPTPPPPHHPQIAFPTRGPALPTPRNAARRWRRRFAATGSAAAATASVQMPITPARR